MIVMMMMMMMMMMIKLYQRVKPCSLGEIHTKKETQANTTYKTEKTKMSTLKY